MKSVKAIKEKLKPCERINIDVEDKRGRTTLEMTCVFQRTRLLKFLLKKGANPDLMGTKADQSLLMIACQKGNVEITKLLLQSV